MSLFLHKVVTLRNAPLLLLLAILPYRVHAVEAPTDFASLVNIFLNLINLAIPFLLALVFLFLIWKMIDSWIINAADDTKRAEGKRYALIAVLVLVLMLSAWGIVALLRLSIFGE